MRPFLKNEKGLTLLELLATLTIFAIVVSISVLLVEKIIEDNKKDSFLADAEMFVQAARLAQVFGEGSHKITAQVKDAGFDGGIYFTLKDLMDLGYFGKSNYEYEIERSVVVAYKGTYSVRLFMKEPYNHQVIPKGGEKRETPLVNDQGEKYIVNRSMSFHGDGGKKSVAYIEDVRGNRKLVHLPPKKS